MEVGKDTQVDLLTEKGKFITRFVSGKNRDRMKSPKILTARVLHFLPNKVLILSHSSKTQSA
jgi:hypothetical protein